MVTIPHMNMVKYGGWFVDFFTHMSCFPFAICSLVCHISNASKTSMIQVPWPMPYAHGAQGSQGSLAGSAQHERPCHEYIRILHCIDNFSKYINMLSQHKI